MIPVRIGHTLKRFYFRVNLFNNHSLPRKPCVVKLPSCVQSMLFTRFFRNPTLRVKFFYPKIPKLSL
jgi:hypothetical protein